MSAGGRPSPAPADPLDARHNFRLLLLVSALIGLALAVYENLLPVYLEQAGISFADMGWIFAAAALVAAGVRIGAGAWSDHAGRKAVYALSLFVQAAASLLTPFTGSVAAQGLLKSLLEPAMTIRETLHSVLLFEGASRRFIAIFGQTRGIEFFFRFLGVLLAAGAYAAMESAGVARPAAVLLAVGGAMVWLAAGVFWRGYREAGFVRSPRPGLRAGDLLRPGLHGALWRMAAAEFIFNIGLSCSHCFAMQHFFLKRFALGAGAMLVIMALHRLFFAVPLLFVGRIVKRRLKETYIGWLVVEGVLVAVPAYLQNIWWAAGVWLLHDFFGAGLWVPAQHGLLQQYAERRRRGRQVSAALAIGSLGLVPGPILAGMLIGLEPTVGRDLAFGLPFLVGGMLVVAAPLPVIGLRPPADDPGD